MLVLLIKSYTTCNHYIIVINKDLMYKILLKL